MLSLKAEFALRKPRIKTLGVPLIAPPPPSGTGSVPIRSKRLNYNAKKAGGTRAKAVVKPATGTTVPVKTPVPTALQEALNKVEIKDAVKKRARELDPPNPPPTPSEIGNAQGERVTAKKNRVAADEKQALKDHYGITDETPQGFRIPYVTPAIETIGNTIRSKVIQPAANALIGRDMSKNEIRGTLAGLTLAPIAAGAAIYQNNKNKEAEQEKQEQAQGYRDKVAEIIARRNLIREQRGIDPDSLQAQQAEKNRLDLEERKFDFEQKKQKAFLGQVGEKELQPRLGYNHFNASVKQAEFIFGRPKPQGVDWKKGAAVAVGGYGLLSGLNKKRNEDALRINKIKDKEDRAAALDYYNSAQYNVDNVISNVPTALGLSNIVPDTLAHPLIAPAPHNKEEEEIERKKPKWTNYRTQAVYSKPKSKQTADFFLPLIVPAISIAGAGYGLYRRKKEAKKKDEILEAEKLAALDRIQDPELRAGLLSKARGQLIDDTSRAQLVDSALNGDYKSALGIGLKKVNFDNK
jgi:hypothetical protein